MQIVQMINGRRIVEHDPIGHYTAPWYTVEQRGPKVQGECLYVFRPFDNLQVAIAEAERLGPIPSEPEIDA